MTNKDYSLLRPFDLEAAKAGANICCLNNGDELEFVAEGGPDKQHCIRLGKWHCLGENLATWNEESIRMAPLCWVEGKPVYKGDPLYRKEIGRDGEVFIADSVVRDSEGDVFLHYAGDGGSSWIEGPGSMVVDSTWTPPNVKREGWGVMRIGKVKDSREEAESILKNIPACNVLADVFEGELRVVRIEWEE